MRIIFMGTPEFAVPALEALISTSTPTAPSFTSPASGGGKEGDCGGGKGGATTVTSQELLPPPLSPPVNGGGSAKLFQAGEIEIVAVYSQPPRPAGRGQQLRKSPIHELAEQHGIPVFTPTSLKSAEAQAEFAALNADVAVVVAYGLLLPQAILDATVHGCINIHPSRLPRWRGAAPIQRTIMAGDTTTEICIMKMDAGLDTGDIYLRSAPIPISETMNAGALHDTLARDAAPLLLQVLADIAAGKARAAPQHAEGVTYAHKISKEESRINWSKSAAEIANHIRGLSPHPGATCLLDGEVLKVFGATASPAAGAVGTTLDDQLTIACGDGAIQLLEVQKAGKPRMSAQAFLRGHGVAKGSILG